MDIFDEARESLKEEKIQKFLQQNHKRILGIVAVFIVILTLFTWWNQYSRERIYEDGGNYMMAVLKMRSYNPDEATTKFEEIIDNNSIYSVMANLNLGAYNSFKGNTDNAIRYYENISKNSYSPKALYDLAELMRIKTNFSTNSELEPELINQLEAYVKKNPIFKSSAQELLLAAYLKQEDYEKAKAVHQVLATDINVPKIIRDRVEQLQSLF